MYFIIKFQFKCHIHHSKSCETKKYDIIPFNHGEGKRNRGAQGLRTLDLGGAAAALWGKGDHVYMDILIQCTVTAPRHHDHIYRNLYLVGLNHLMSPPLFIILF